MDKVLFSITCTTCQARLKVRDPAAIGEILACPRCGSFVHVLPPPGWDPLARSTPAEEPAAPESDSVDTASPAAKKPLPPPLPTAADLARLADLAAEVELVLPPNAWSRRARLVRKWLLWGVLPLGVVIAAVSAWIVASSSSKVDPVDQMKAEIRNSAKPAAPVLPRLPKPEVARAREGLRWIPAEARLVVTLPVAQWSALPQETNLPKAQGSIAWRPLLEAFRLRPSAVRQLSWATTDLAHPTDSAVVLLDLAANADAEPLKKAGQPAGLVVAGAECRKLAESTWKHPFAVIGPRAVVTGREDLLRNLAQGPVTLQSKPLEQLLQTSLPVGTMAVRMDLTAVRKAGLPTPVTLFDIWPTGRAAWHTLWDTPDGLGLSVELGDQLRVELALTAADAAAATKTKTALDEFLKQARPALSRQVDVLLPKLKAEQVAVPEAAQYERLLKAALQTIQAAKLDSNGTNVTLRSLWPQSSRELLQGVLESRPVIAADWSAALRTADEAQQRRLLAALRGHEKDTGRWPSAAAGGALLPPETRLSWIATLLPYLDRPEWHRQLEFGDQWNGVHNRPVVERVLDEVVNPRLGPSRTEAGFPVTHYVGVAGVGPDAARLKADDPRAGMFGYGRTTRPEEITDGASNTIAVLGVSGNLGAWAAGGQATVRPLTKAPYVNGPDGFGSGQPDGMLAGMADGSVRFISKDVAPRVVEQLATIHGGGPSPLEALMPKSAAKPAQPEAKPAEKPATQPAAKPAEKPPEKPAQKTAAMPASKPIAPPKPGVSEVDLPTRLAAVIPEISYTDVPLGDLLPVVEMVCGVSITLDLDAMSRLGVTLTDKVRLQQSAKTVRELLEALAATRGLIVTQVNGCVVLTSPEAERHKLKTIPYSVSDIVGTAPKDIAAFGSLVRLLVAPASWRSAGGLGTLKPSGDALVVEQTDPVHGQIIDFCERLRAARGLPLRSRFNSDKFSLTPRSQRAAAALSRPVTLSFFQPTPLSTMLDALEKAGPLKIVVDWAALNTDSLAIQVKGTLKASGLPLAEALDALLQPLGLGYRVVDANLLQVSSQKALAERLELEFYPVREFVAAGQTGPGLVDKIKRQVTAPAWSPAGPAEIQFDQLSSTLIVLQSQPAQRTIARLLDGLRPPPAKK